MDIRKPKSEEYRPGHFSPEVKYINELRIKEARKKRNKNIFYKT